MGYLTLREAIDEYKDIYMASRNFAERTREEYFNDLEDLLKFLEQLGTKEIKNLEQIQLIRYLAELDRRGLAGVTRKKKVVVIRSFLSYLYQSGYLKINLANRVIPPFTEAKSPRFLTKSEYERLLDVSAHHPRDFAMIQLLLQTGIKLSELTQITRNDVILPSTILPDVKDMGHLNIAGSRSKKARTIPLNEKVCASLRKYFRVGHNTQNTALFANRFGNQLGPRGVEKIVNKYMHQINISDASVHSLRHTFGMHHILSGAQLKVIQEVMGHRDSRTTSMYSSLAKAAMEREFRGHSL
jgi:integrase/recombinase XerC